MFRITNAMMYNNALTNLNQQNQSMFTTSQQISSGKRVNTPADDPLAIGEIMRYQDQLNRNTGYTTNGQKATGYLNTSDSLVANITDIATRAQTIALGQASGTSTADTRLTTASEVDSLIAQAIQVGNSKIGSDYVFGGLQTNIPPIAQDGTYVGGNTSIQASILDGSTIGATVLGSQFLSADLSPRVNAATPLSSLRRGLGIGAGTFTITDRAGATGTVNVTAGMSVSSLINAVNASGANVTAAISPDGLSLQIKDNNTANVTGPLTIQNGTGTGASDLGIAGARSVATITGDHLNAVVTATTNISDLFGGTGMPTTPISVKNGAASATVTFAGAVTVGDIINAINASGANVTAAINPNGNALTLTSNNPATVAYALDINSGTTASLLGFGGGRNLISSLQKLSAALRNNDTSAIAGLTDNFTASITNTTALRGEIGARVNRISTTGAGLDQANLNTNTLLSNAQDADMAKAISDFALLQTAYQATAKATSMMIQPSLVNFL